MSRFELTPVTPPPRRAPGFSGRVLLLIGCGVVLALAAVTWVVALARHGAAPEVAGAGERQHQRREVGPKERGHAEKEGAAPERPKETESSQKPPKQEAEKDGTAQPKRAEPAPKTKVEPATAAEDREATEALRSALGALTGISIQQAHLNVGLLADGVEAQTYKPAEAAKVLETVNAALITADRKLEQLPEKALGADDREDVARVRQALRLLMAQVKALRAYWADKSKESAERFQKAREESRRAIKELLQTE